MKGLLPPRGPKRRRAPRGTCGGGVLENVSTQAGPTRTAGCLGAALVSAPTHFWGLPAHAGPPPARLPQETVTDRHQLRLAVLPRAGGRPGGGRKGQKKRPEGKGLDKKKKQSKIAIDI